ncbi:methyltransferase [Agromyces sp. SYSU K20354]|uniref:putative RNA methyltransferase n=1 Tax=Agromyces cavernae TaxID=2898659 RepID=UPI001E5CBB0B|nr:methyltransferase domain-containing protein [Agromyces cavernae]MCD2442116.1 methyltransferase [Agromyces cavernae]
MSIDSTWLRCPNCFLDLAEVDGRVFGCAAGHRYDRAKQGYLTLLPPKAPRTVGDDREMLQARSALLDGGAYARIAAAITDAVVEQHTLGGRSALRIADLGCGTGHYSTVLSQAVPEADFLLADRSPDAVRMSLRALPSATGVVLDLWRPLPLRDGVVDVALNVFAPRNGVEFARVLDSSGLLIVVVPTTAHLQELRLTGALLDVPAGKSDRVAEQLSESGLVLRSTTSVEYTFSADAATRNLLANMGPSAHHGDSLSSTDARAVEPVDVTVSVEVLSFEHSTAVPA